MVGEEIKISLIQIMVSPTQEKFLPEMCKATRGSR